MKTTTTKTAKPMQSRAAAQHAKARATLRRLFAKR